MRNRLEEAVIYSPNYGTDGYGDKAVTSWSEGAKLKGFLSPENPAEPIEEGRKPVALKAKFYVRSESATTLNADYRLKIRNQTYQLDGEPNLWLRPIGFGTVISLTLLKDI